MTKLSKQTLARLIQYGDKWADETGAVKIMALVDSWVMVRRPRCMPFCISLRDFDKRFRRLTNEDDRL